ncbi:MAG: F0F1 ATP synthase subunit delta [Gammaproteobacteria bacterium]|jgi:F-type H+-transporting ATPase subunit delta|nr:F0F1 ATP synthase subunit delta [Chromatiales bacterium]MDP6674349.1 F0F1 ATP synthase subunit delta [Gammaproteobacteria bacterium]
MAENSGIARPYAQAAFELARDAGQLTGWSETLHVAGQAVSDAALAAMIDAPGTDDALMVGIIADVCQQAVTTPVDAGRVKNLLRLLAENDRLPVLADIARQFDKLKTNVENSIDVVLTAAAPVDDAQQAKISEALKKRFNRDINLHFTLDETLIGGARLQADDLVIDGSIRTGLEKLSSTLTN